MKKKIGLILLVTALSVLFVVPTFAAPVNGVTLDTAINEFDYLYYAAANPDVVAQYGNTRDALLTHFVTYGYNEGRWYHDLTNKNWVKPVIPYYPSVENTNTEIAPVNDVVEIFRCLEYSDTDIGGMAFPWSINNDVIIPVINPFLYE